MDAGVQTERSLNPNPLVLGPAVTEGEGRGQGAEGKGWKQGNRSKLRLISCFITKIFDRRTLICVSG